MPDKVEKTRLVVYLPPDVHKAILHRAIDEDTSATAIIERLVREYLAKPKPRKEVRRGSDG